MIIDEYYDEEKEEYVKYGEDVSAPPYPKQEVIDAMRIVANDEWLAVEFEDANYHSAQDNLLEYAKYAEKELKLKRVESPY